MRVTHADPCSVPLSAITGDKAVVCPAAKLDLTRHTLLQDLPHHKFARMANDLPGKTFLGITLDKHERIHYICF